MTLMMFLGPEGDPEGAQHGVARVRTRPKQQPPGTATDGNGTAALDLVRVASDLTRRIEELSARNQSLLEANNRLVEENRALRREIEALRKDAARSRLKPEPRPRHEEPSDPSPEEILRRIVRGQASAMLGPIMVGHAPWGGCPYT